MTLSKSQFTNLYNQYLPALQSFAMKLTRNPSKADDLVQETALKAFKAKHTFKEGTNFKSWTFTILKNNFISMYRKSKKRSRVDKPIEELSLAGTSFSVRNRGESNLQVEEIQNHISDLSEKCQRPFKLHRAGFQYNEISQKLNIPMGTVKSRINYARTALKKRVMRFA